MRSIVLQGNELASASALSKRHVRVAESYGGGYVVDVAGFRNLYCLNMLRQSLYFNAKHYSNFGPQPEKGLRRELDLCLDTLRQELMCVVDRSVRGLIWLDRANNRTVPDFTSSDHLCYDFQKVREWTASQQVPKSLPSDYYQQANSQED